MSMRQLMSQSEKKKYDQQLMKRIYEPDNTNDFTDRYAYGRIYCATYLFLYWHVFLRRSFRRNNLEIIRRDTFRNCTDLVKL